MARSALLAGVLAVTLALAGAARAEGEDALRARDDRIADLEAKLETVVDELARLREQVAVPEEPELKSAYGFGPAASKIYGVERGLSIGGYGEANYVNFIGDEADTDLDRADALRTVLYFGYKFSERIVFNSEIEFEHATTSDVGNGAGSGSVSVELAALDFFLHEKVNARAGLLLLPMGFLNEVHEPPFFHGVTRPVTEQQILPSTWRENGAGIFGELSETFEYRAYVVSGFNASRFSDSGIRGGRQQGNRSLSEDLAFVARADWRPEAVPGLMLGGSFYFGDSGQDLESGGMDVPDTRMWIGELHAQYRSGPLHARALFAYTDLSDTRELNLVLGRAADHPIAEAMLGGYAEVAWDVWPSLFGDADKRLEPFLRVEYVDTQYDVPAGFTPNRRNAFWVYTPGVNFYPHPNVVLKLEYRNFDARGGTRPDELALGVGFAF
jgi:hypothetical protein